MRRRIYGTMVFSIFIATDVNVHALDNDYYEDSLREIEQQLYRQRQELRYEELERRQRALEFEAEGRRIQEFLDRMEESVHPHYQDRHKDLYDPGW